MKNPMDPQPQISKYLLTNNEVLKYFSTRKAKKLFESIYQGKISSERHNIMWNMITSGKIDLSINSPIFHLTQLQFLEDDGNIDKLLWKILSKVIDDVNQSSNLGFNSITNQFKHKYAFHVLVPEGIISLLMKKNNWSIEKAEKVYLDAESRVTTDEQEQFLNEINQTIEEDEICGLKEIYPDSQFGNDYQQGRANLDLPDIETNSELDPLAVVTNTDNTYSSHMDILDKSNIKIIEFSRLGRSVSNKFLKLKTQSQNKPKIEIEKVVEHNVKLHFDDKNILKDKSLNKKNSSRTCERCAKKLKTKQTLRYHLMTHEYLKNQDLSVACQNCPNKFHTFRALRNHLKAHAKHTCNKCQRIFISENNLKKHQCLYCDKCRKLLSTPQSLRTHLKKHKLYKNQCEKCKRMFRNKASLIDHRPLCSFCMKCTQGFQSKQELICHLNTHDHNKTPCSKKPGPTTVRFGGIVITCTQCQKRLEEDVLGTHVCNICKTCKKVFNSSRSLESHMKVHKHALNISGNKMQECRG